MVDIFFWGKNLFLFRSWTLLVLVFLFVANIGAASTYKFGYDPAMEFSFGSSQLFIGFSDYEDLNKKEKEIIPTHAALLLGEFFIWKKWRLLTFTNLPLSTQKFVVDGVIYEEKAAPVAGMGPVWAPWQLKTVHGVLFEPQISLLLGAAIKRDFDLVPAPLSAARLHLSTPDGFTMYLGGSAVLGVHSLSLIYGVGHRF
jgi:hypothetical protein